jgi:hypothetical protein
MPTQTESNSVPYYVGQIELDAENVVALNGADGNKMAFAKAQVCEFITTAHGYFASRDELPVEMRACPLAEQLDAVEQVIRRVLGTSYQA